MRSNRLDNEQGASREELWYRIAVDVGGTFTDLMAVDNKGSIVISKTPTTKDILSGVVDALSRAAKEIGLSLEEFLSKTKMIVHGTTISTNAVLTYSGAKTGLLTTENFEDILEIRKGHKEEIYNLTLAPPPVLVPKYLRLGIEERVKWNGEVHTPLNENDVSKATKKLKDFGVESIAVCYLWSFMHPEHEKRTAEIIQREYPGVYTSISSEIAPLIREYERTSTTVLNAYVGPALASYLEKLCQILNDHGYRYKLLIMQANGGITTSDIAIEKAVNTTNSGIAAHATSGTLYGGTAGYRDIITLEMGGTTFEVCLITKDRGATVRTSGEINRYHLSIPMIDLHTIGAGGGSVAWVDPLGLLRVGPKSAAADPGPACYRKGGEEPTVTDADVVLGYLNPDFFCGGEIKLDAEAAKKAIKEKIADHLGKDVAQAAHDIYNVTNSNMMDAVRVITIQRGEDPSEYVAVVGGGAGPVHVARIAAGLKIPIAIIPKASSAFCAAGMLASDIKHDFALAYACRTASLDIEKMNELYREMEMKGNSTLAEEGVNESDRYFIRSADMRYVGQIREVEVEVPNGALTEKEIPVVEESFHERHEKLYSHRVMENPTEIVDLRVIAGGRIPKLQFPKQKLGSKNSSKALNTERSVFWEEDNQFVKTPIYDGDKLRYGDLIQGPAIIEERTTTVVIPPKYEVEVERHGNYIMKVPV